MDPALCVVIFDPEPLTLDWQRGITHIMPELALDDVRRHALAQQLERVHVPQLMRREAPAHPGPHGATAKRRACRGGVPCSTARAAVDDAEQRTDRHRLARSQPRLELLEPPVVHADLAPAASL